MDINNYPVYALADRFQRAGYTFADTGINPQFCAWKSILHHDDFGPKLKQRLWLALVAMLDLKDNVQSDEQFRLYGFATYFLHGHGLNLDSSAPLTELEIQIIHLLPAAIEYAMNRIESQGNMYYMVS